MAAAVSLRRALRSAGISLLALLVGTVVFSACATKPGATLPPWEEIYRRPGWSGGATVDLRVVGDVMLGRYVGEVAARDGAAAPFAHLGDLLAADLVVGNLESPLTTQRDSVRPGPYRLLADPNLAPALATAGFDALSLANNHGLDAGSAGLAETSAALHNAGIVLLGAETSAEAARRATILEQDDLKIALLALNDVLDPADAAMLAPADDLSWTNPDFQACDRDCPYGRAWLDTASLANVTQAQHEADVVVVIVHWGIEYSLEPSARQRAWASRLIAAGADLVIGAHPHVVQPSEWLQAGERSGFVAYSLGNFIFDGPADSSQNSGIALRILLDRDGIAAIATAPVPPRRWGSGPMPTTTPPPANGQRWTWDGSTGQASPIPPNLVLPPRPARIAVDLRGNGDLLWATLGSDGLVTIRDGDEAAAPLVWQNETSAWRFTRIASGDPNDDGRIELVLLLWQRNSSGQLVSQPYLLGWRSGRYQIIWGGSATPVPIQDLLVADLDQDGRSELVVLEGGTQPGDPGTVVSVWHWHGWGFQREWTSAPGRWQSLRLADSNADGRSEIIALPSE